MPSMPLGHTRVHSCAESQKYDGDFMTSSKSRIWTTVQYPKHIIHKHIPDQIYLCHARKPLILCKKPHHLYSAFTTGLEWKKLFQSRGCSHTSLPSTPAVPKPQGRFPQITGLQGRVIVKTTREAHAGSRSVPYLGITSSA